MGVYYASPWFNVLVSYIDPVILDNYTEHQFILYDNVAPYNDSLQFLSAFEKNVASNTNIAYVSKFESIPSDWLINPLARPQAEDNPLASGKLSILSSDANTLKIKTHLSNSQFLVINDNYNSEWHVFINGHPARLLRANVSFKGLWIPAGDSSIVLRFLNPMRYALHWGLIILFLGTFLYLLVLLKIYV